ncbi:DUF5989 family protein [bacterium]|nr:DUF5989 family protein [bacterium]
MPGDSIGEEKVIIDSVFPALEGVGSRLPFLLERSVKFWLLCDMAERQSLQSQSATEFSEMAEDRQPGFLSEFWGFLRQNKKWWLTPILMVLFLLIVLVIISQTPLAPFIYPFF